MPQLEQTARTTPQLISTCIRRWSSQAAYQRAGSHVACREYLMAGPSLCFSSDLSPSYYFPDVFHALLQIYLTEVARALVETSFMKVNAGAGLLCWHGGD